MTVSGGAPATYFLRCFHRYVYITRAGPAANTATPTLEAGGERKALARILQHRKTQFLLRSLQNVNNMRFN